MNFDLTNIYNMDLFLVVWALFTITEFLRHIIIKINNRNIKQFIINMLCYLEFITYVLSVINFGFEIGIYIANKLNKY